LGLPWGANAFGSASGKTLVLKVSGAEINSTAFSTLVADITHLTSLGVNIVLCFGGGDQITKEYSKNATTPREKIDGVGVTTADVLNAGVIPAYRDMRQQLQSSFPSPVFVEPSDVKCSMIEDSRFGLVGVPQEIALPDAPLSIVGFTGMVDEQLVNVNADDIARQLAQQYRDRIEELILLTGTGGVLDTQGKIVPAILGKKLDEILQQQSRTVSVTDGMLKKLQAVREALSIVGKVVITKTDSLEKELLQWMGDGTMIIDEAQCHSSPLLKKEERILDAVIEANVQKRAFRTRGPDELERLKDNHDLLRIKESPLGGFSVLPHKKWLELSAVWAGTIGNGIGRMVMDAAIKKAGPRPMYALSADADAITAFQAHQGFESKGRLSEVKESDGTPAHLRSYDTSERNPVLFIAKQH
jgi:acetylglutamate kinase